MDFNPIKNALLTVTTNVGHYEALKKTDRYIVWAEDGQFDALWSDDRMGVQIVEGTVDYFTRMEDDPNVDDIQAALNLVCMWRLSSVQYEDDTRYIHWEWVWRLEHGMESGNQ